MPPRRLPDPLLLLGGTFDPVHYGHLRLAEDVERAFAPCTVCLVPSRDPPHRGTPHASAGDRLAMLQLAVGDFPNLAVDAREVARAGKSYTIVTLEELRREAPARPLGLVLGADALLGLAEWHRWRELFELAHLVVVERPGVRLAIDRLPPQLQQEWRGRCNPDAAAVRDRPAGAIVMQAVRPQAISASSIRGALARGHPEEVRGLLPPAVLAYIETHRLYGP